MDTSDNIFTVISETLDSLFHPLGFECYEFKIGWYNDQVNKVFHLPYDYNTLAFVVINNPDMFEKAFKPFINAKHFDGLKDPIDECCTFYFQKVCQAFPNYDIDVLHDFELDIHRRPKILVQTAGHISGAAYYYRKENIKNKPWSENQRIYGVSIHPEYGGWFAFRGVLIFKNVLYSVLTRKLPQDIIPSEEKKILLLNLFNSQWKDWTYRDIISVGKKYSEEQMTYFSTEPLKRWSLLGIDSKITKIDK